MSDVRTIQVTEGAMIESDRVLTAMGLHQIRSIETIIKELFFKSSTDGAVIEGMIIVPVSGMTVGVTGTGTILQNITNHLKIGIDDDINDVTLDASDPTNPRIDIIEAQVQLNSVLTDTQVNVLLGTSGTASYQTRDREYEVEVVLRARAGTPAGSPVCPGTIGPTAASLTGPVLPTTQDLSTSYLVRLRHKRNGEYVTVDCRGADPGNTTQSEIANAINTALGFTFITISANKFVATATDTGEESYFEFVQPENFQFDYFPTMFGLTPPNDYIYTYSGDNGWLKIAEVTVPAGASSISGGNILPYTSRASWTADNNAVETFNSYYDHLKSEDSDHVNFFAKKAGDIAQDFIANKLTTNDIVHKNYNTRESLEAVKDLAISGTTVGALKIILPLHSFEAIEMSIRIRDKTGAAYTDCEVIVRGYMSDQTTPWSSGALSAEIIGEYDKTLNVSYGYTTISTIKYCTVLIGGVSDTYTTSQIAIKSIEGGVTDFGSEWLDRNNYTIAIDSVLTGYTNQFDIIPSVYGNNAKIAGNLDIYQRLVNHITNYKGTGSHATWDSITVRDAIDFISDASQTGAVRFKFPLVFSYRFNAIFVVRSDATGGPSAIVHLSGQVTNTPTIASCKAVVYGDLTFSNRIRFGRTGSGEMTITFGSTTDSHSQSYFNLDYLHIEVAGSSDVDWLNPANYTANLISTVVDAIDVDLNGNLPVYGYDQSIPGSITGDSLNLLNANGFFGIGGYGLAVPSNNANLIVDSGVYAGNSSTVSNLPYSVSAGFNLIHAQYGTNYATQYYSRIGGAGSQEVWFRTNVNGTWSAWELISSYSTVNTTFAITITADGLSASSVNSKTMRYSRIGGYWAVSIYIDVQLDPVGSTLANLNIQCDLPFRASNFTVATQGNGSASGMGNTETYDTSAIVRTIASSNDITMYVRDLTGLSGASTSWLFTASFLVEAG